MKDSRAELRMEVGFLVAMGSHRLLQSVVRLRVLRVYIRNIVSRSLGPRCWLQDGVVLAFQLI